LSTSANKILEHNVDGILGRVETCFDQGKAGLHKEHQDGRDQEHHVVNRICDLGIAYIPILCKSTHSDKAEDNSERHSSNDFG
jgi:hypothetical protein